MIVENGLPKNINDRLPKEQRVYAFLDSLGIDYNRVDHEPAMTMEACEEIDEVLGTSMCKNLFLSNRQETAFYLLLMPADKPFKTKDLSAQIGSSRLSFASHEKMSEILDITPGSLTVLGLMNDLDMDVTLLIDKDLLSCEYFGCHPAINTSTLKFKTSDLTEKLIPALKHRPTVVELPLCEEEG
jgi:Ala-tRNA(Pro) deacylase